MASGDVVSMFVWRSIDSEFPCSCTYSRNNVVIMLIKSRTYQNCADNKAYSIMSMPRIKCYTESTGLIKNTLYFFGQTHN